MKGTKQYRFQDNPKEKMFYDNFIEMFGHNNMTKKTLSSIIFGWKNNTQTYPNEYLDDEGEIICVNLIQWLGSPVGLSFLDKCGFVEKVNTKTRKI